MIHALATNFADASPVADEWAGTARLTFKRGEEIYARDEDADLVYRLVRGAARTSHLLADGRRFPAESLSDCEVLAIRRSGSATYETGRHCQPNG